MQVLITRAEPAASRSAKRLKERGFDPVVCPIFQVIDIGTAMPENSEKHYIFTSANAVQVLLDRGWKPSGADKTAWCVGSRTEEAAKKLGFLNTIAAMGGGKKLAEKIAAANLPDETRFIYPTTPDRSFDMKTALMPLRHSVIPVNIYKTEIIEPDQNRFAAFMGASEHAAIFIYSERSARVLDDFLSKFIPIPEFQTLTLVSISQSATNILLKYPWHGVYVPKCPNESSMISQLEKLDLA